ncbi:MAG: glycosyl hydrolase-related protein [Janthinobacterium lividum]
MTEKSPKLPQVFVYYANHFDLIWRRGWQRGYEYGGLFYRSYADLEDAVIGRWLTLAAEEGAAFQIEQGLTLREYLRRHPDTLPVFQQLASESRFELLGGGESIIDLNTCHGETLARNYASGTVYARQTLGQKTALACHADGFGSSAQFPQVARLCGMRGVTDLSYSKPDGPYWRGLDGSTIYAISERPGKFFFYDHCYYEPCLTCRGYAAGGAAACEICAGTGLRLSQGVYPPREDWSPEEGSDYSHYLVFAEEMLPDEQLPEFVRAKNAEGRAQWRWKTQSALMPVWEEALAQVDSPSVPVSSRVENNPIHSSTLVTRIRVKQAARMAESWYYPSEKLASLAFAETNARQENAAGLERAWLHLPMLFFHDAVTGTHIDPALEELLDIAEEAAALSRDAAAAAADLIMPGAKPVVQWEGDGSLAVFNPHSFAASLPVEIPAAGEGYRVTDALGQTVPVYRQPSQSAFAEDSQEIGMRVKTLQAVGAAHWQKRDAEAPRTLRFLAADLPPLSTAVYHLTPTTAALPSIVSRTAQAAGYRIGWDDHGVSSVIAEDSGQELMPQGRGPLGHLILEEDRGDPWGTRYAQRGRTSFAPETRLLRAEQREGSVEITFGGRMDSGDFGFEAHPSVFGLEWLQTVRLLEGLPWIEIEMEIFWAGIDHRLRVAFPTRASTDRGLYHIPYGVLMRDRYEMTETGLWSPNGDWPALHFAATEPEGDVPGMAVFNTGTPSARIENGTLMYSILRSPGFGHALTRYAQEYPLPTAELRDGGHHRFRFALMPNTGANLPRILEAAAVLNDAVAAFHVPAGTRSWQSGLSLADPGAFVSAVKQKFDGTGLAVRVAEQLGQARSVTLTVPAQFTRVRLANLLEEPESDLPVQAGQVQVPLRAFGIHTILLESGE